MDFKEFQALEYLNDHDLVTIIAIIKKYKHKNGRSPGEDILRICTKIIFNAASLEEAQGAFSHIIELVLSLDEDK